MGPCASGHQVSEVLLNVAAFRPTIPAFGCYCCEATLKRERLPSVRDNGYGPSELIDLLNNTEFKGYWRQYLKTIRKKNKYSWRQVVLFRQRNQTLWTPRLMGCDYWQAFTIMMLQITCACFFFSNWLDDVSCEQVFLLYVVVIIIRLWWMFPSDSHFFICCLWYFWC